MSDLIKAASLPDDTPVELLPLRRHTINALRTAGIRMLGDLRLMRDGDLLQLRRFGRAALADVRALVPAPGARP
jgi:DNA-directed RNA polymerase alpha subunit